MQAVDYVIENYAEVDGRTDVAWWMSEEVQFLRRQVVTILLDDRGDVDVFYEADDEVLVNEAKGVVLLRVEFGVDVSVLDPGVKEGKMILLGGDEGDDELVAEGSEGLAVKGPGGTFPEDVDSVLEFTDGACDAGVFTGGSEELEGALFECQVVAAVWRENEGFSFG